MNEGGLSPRVRDFVVRHITSIEQLELLILFASNPGKRWTIRQLVNEIRSSEASVSGRVRQLVESGFVAGDNEAFGLAFSAGERLEAILELTTAYRQYHVRVVELIYSRAGALKSFSDAFKIKPKE